MDEDDLDENGGDERKLKLESARKKKKRICETWRVKTCDDLDFRRKKNPKSKDWLYLINI